MNHSKGWNVRYRWFFWMIIMVAVPLVGCGVVGTKTDAASPSYTGQLRGAVFEPARSLADFTLPTTAGDAFTLSAHRGQVILLYFGYLTCPDFCPTTLADLKSVYQKLNQPAEQVKVVFITIDPERDTPERIDRYIRNFDTRFIGLRGEGDALKNVLSEFGIVAERRQVGDSPESYLIDHTASVFMINPDGQLQAQYLFGTASDDILHDVQVVLDAA